LSQQASVGFRAPRRPTSRRSSPERRARLFCPSSLPRKHCSTTTSRRERRFPMSLLLESPLPNRTYQGKVRDTYDLGERLLIVATDRISAFDVVLPTGIPQKGVVLTQLSLFWFRLLEGLTPHH